MPVTQKIKGPDDYVYPALFTLWGEMRSGGGFESLPEDAGGLVNLLLIDDEWW